MKMIRIKFPLVDSLLDFLKDSHSYSVHSVLVLPVIVECGWVLERMYVLQVQPEDAIMNQYK